MKMHNCEITISSYRNLLLRTANRMHLLLISALLHLVIPIQTAESAQSCGNPGIVRNGRRTGSVFTFPNSVTYSCDPGYRLRGQATRYCQESGSWSGRLPECEVVTCEAPRNPENGHVTALFLEYSSELSYECDEGFSLSTDETVYCTEDGSWSRSDVTCIVDSACEKPPDINFASLAEESDDPYYIGTIVTYGCQYGYVVTGNSKNIKCIRSGNKAKWTEPQFMCTPQSCGNPGLVKNGHRAGSLFTFPNSVTYSCDPGYRLRGLATRYCQTSGSWSGRLPECEVVTCEAPRNPENGHVTALFLEYESELSYKCDKGFSLSTDETVYCTEDGSWSRSDVTCIEAACEIPPKPEFGYVSFGGVEERPRAGSIAIFSCEDGRIPDGPTTSKCLDIGIWTFHPPKCLEPCTIVYVSYGDIWKYVTEGRFRRKVLKKMNYGTAVEDNEELLLRCYDGFEAAGTRNRETKMFCEKGRWSLEPVCEPASCRSNVPLTANVEVVDIDDKHGGIVSYSCISDYKKIVEETVICDKGVWKGVAPTCITTKCSVNTLKSNGLMKGSKVYYRDGEVFEVACDPRYRLAAGNRDQIICQEGIWIGDSSPCLPANCSDLPPRIEHGRVRDPTNMAHGSIAKYVCEDPYVLEEASLVQCVYGEWTGELPRCQDSRCYLRDLKNLNYVSRKSQPDTFSGDRLKIACDEGYSPKSQMPLCRNGAWDQAYEPLCEESDCEIPGIDNGSVQKEILGDWYWSWKRLRWERNLSFSTIPQGSAVSSDTVLWFYCNAPHSVHGEGKERLQIRCSRGRWSTDLRCHRVRLVTSTAASILKRLTPVPRPSTSNPVTTAEYLPLSTTPRTDVKWSSPISVDEAVVTLPSEPPAEECFCEYPIDDGNIVAHADGKRLIYGDRVRNGTTVVLHCLHVGYHRFRGRQKITCSGCPPWHSSDFPSCVAPERGDAAIVFDRDVAVLTDGTVEIRKGQNVNLTCVAMELNKFPEWNAPEAPGIAFIQERRERENFRDVVYLTHLEIQNADDANEGMYECSIEGRHETMLTVIVKDPDLRCPVLPEDDEIIINYEMERRENTKVSFSCPKKGQEIIGQPVLTCLRSGQWSDPPPRCSGVRCEVLETNDLLVIDYSGDREVGDYVYFHCPIPGKRSGASLTRCLKNGTWENPTPTCKIPDCPVEALLSSLPSNAVPAVDNSKNKSLPYKSTVKLTCNDDLIAVGSPEAKCIEESKWKIDTVSCESGCLLPTKPPSSKLILHPIMDIYKFGEKLTLSCPPGMTLNKESQVIMCGINGWLDPVLPECKENHRYKGLSANEQDVNQADSEN